MGVETAMAVGGLAMSAGTTALSFIDAGNARARQREAERAAIRAMEEARKKLDINYTDQLAIMKEPYELQREALLSQGAQAIQAGVESERGAVATAGKVQMAQNEAQAGIRTAMGNEMAAIEKQRVAEESRLRDLRTQLDLGEVEGQQMIAANAQEQAAAATRQGVEGIASTMQQGLGMINLFPGGGSDITTSGFDKGPGANAAFQSPVGNRFAPEVTSQTVVQPAMPINTAQMQKPFVSLYQKGYRPGLEYGQEFNNIMPTVNQFAPNPDYYTRRRLTGLGYGADFSGVGGF